MYDANAIALGCVYCVPPHMLHPVYLILQNEVVGTMGVGDAHFVSSSTTLKYTVYFENNPNASLPAQRVQIVYPLDNSLDLRTFVLEQIAFSTFSSDIILNMANIEVWFITDIE